MSDVRMCDPVFGRKAATENSLGYRFEAHNLFDWKQKEAAPYTAQYDRLHFLIVLFSSVVELKLK